jgi:hypothetical protein
MGSSDVDFRAAQSGRLDLLRWFCGTLLGICGAGGVVACLTARVCFGDSRGGSRLQRLRKFFYSAVVWR